MVLGEVERILRGRGHSARGHRFIKAAHERCPGGIVSEKVVRIFMRKRGVRVRYARKGKKCYSSYAEELHEATANLLLRPNGTQSFRPGSP